MLGMYYPLGDHSTGLLEVQGSPTHKILPTWSAFIEFEHMLAHGWGVHLGLRHTDYPESFSDMGNITLERYWSNYQAVYTFSLSHVQDAGYGESHRFQAYYYYGERNRIGVGYSFGKEVEKIDQNRVEVSQVNSYTVLGRHWLDNSWAVTYEISVVEQGDIYTRRGMRVGLRRSF
jgi:YaiO family outer membrane protein